LDGYGIIWRVGKNPKTIMCGGFVENAMGSCPILISSSGGSREKYWWGVCAAKVPIVSCVEECQQT